MRVCGLGLCSRQFLGANIILTCRDHQKGQDAKKEIIGIVPTASIDVKLLDVSIMANIRKFVDKISLQYKTIDVLINNAAVIFQPYKKTVEGFETTLATNYLGMYLSELILEHERPPGSEKNNIT